MSKEIILKFDKKHATALYKMATLLLSQGTLSYFNESKVRDGSELPVVPDEYLIPFANLGHLILLQLHHGNKDELIKIRDYFDSMIKELGGETK